MKRLMCVALILCLGLSDIALAAGGQRKRVQHSVGKKDPSINRRT
jgi:hypothetical protein